MGQDLVPRDEPTYPIALRRSAGRQLTRIQEGALLQRAQVDAEEQNAAYRVGRRIENGHALASHLVENAGKLSRQVTEEIHDNPGLEMIFRGFGEDLARTCRTLIVRHVARS